MRREGCGCVRDLPLEGAAEVKRLGHFVFKLDLLWVQWDCVWKRDPLSAQRRVLFSNRFFSFHFFFHLSSPTVRSLHNSRRRYSTYSLQ